VVLVVPLGDVFAEEVLGHQRRCPR
jgi:hypothetical protein